ncbi:hypothetical protein FO492_05540 [Bacillus paralicheniformis]|nr:hypothetical protein [Bacillus paralicheniformis]RZV63268.1 hypothetical protein EX342_05050 [Bacillus paralicheniformis]
MFISEKKRDFFYSIFSYDRGKKNEREYRVQEGAPTDPDLTASSLFVWCPFFIFATFQSHPAITRVSKGI